jgi:hypothetical protein
MARLAPMLGALLGILVVIAACTATPAGPAPPTGQPPAPTVATHDDVSELELAGYLGLAVSAHVARRGDIGCVAAGLAFTVIDLAAGPSPRRLGATVLPTSARAIAVRGEWAYVAGAGGLHLVDLTRPDRPAVRDTLYPEQTVDGIVVEGDYLYATAGYLAVLDLTDPAAPVEVGRYTPEDARPPLGQVAAVQDDLAVLRIPGASRKSGGFRLVDVGDPTAPKETARQIVPGMVRDLALTGSDLYLLGLGPAVPLLARFDVTNPYAPLAVDLDLDPAVQTIPQIEALSLAAHGDRLYLGVSNQQEEMGFIAVLDVAEPSQVALRGRYEELGAPLMDATAAEGELLISSIDRLTRLDISEPGRMDQLGHYAYGRLRGRLRGVAILDKHAYVATGETGLYIVDTSDPEYPRITGQVDTPGHAWDVVVEGHRLYVADEYRGLHIVSLDDPGAPVRLGGYDRPSRETFFHDLAVQGTLLYVADGDVANGGLRIIDATDPAAPVETGFLPLSSVTGDAADRVPSPRAEAVAVFGDRAVLAAGTGGLLVIDVGDPAAPVVVGAYATPGRAADVAVAGATAYLIDGDLRIIDVSNPTAPALVGFYDLPPGPEEAHVVVQGRYAYVSGSELRVLDVADPAEIRPVAAYPRAAGALAVHGAGVYALGQGLFLLTARGDP